MARSGRGWDAKPPPAPATRGRVVANRRRGPTLPTDDFPDNDASADQIAGFDPDPVPDPGSGPDADFVRELADPAWVRESRGRETDPGPGSGSDADFVRELADPAWVRESRRRETDPARLREAMEQFASGLERRAPGKTGGVRGRGGGRRGDSQRGNDRTDERRGDRDAAEDRAPGAGWSADVDGRTGRGGSGAGGKRGSRVGAGAGDERGSRGGSAVGDERGSRGGSAVGGERGSRGHTDRRKPGSRGEHTSDDRGRADRAGSQDRRGAAGEQESRDPQEVARDICLRLLAVRPRTRAELAQALHKRGIDDEVAAAVLNRYDEVGMIDDAAFARAWVTSRHHGRGLASRALAQELRQRGVSKEDTDEALSELDSETEAQTALDLATRRLKSMHGEPEAIFRRLVGMLARKGYPPGIAVRAVKEALASRDAELAELIDPDAYEE